MTFEEIQGILHNLLKGERYTHTMGVVSTAQELAMLHEYPDIGKVKLAALLHDCAKQMPHEERETYCQQHHVEVTDTERANLTLLHAKCGSIMANEDFGVTDPEILHAIRVHTTGCPGMSLLDLIIFIADYIEPNRKEAPHLDELRELAKTDLNKTAYIILTDTLEYLKSVHRPIDRTTNDTWQYYKQLQEKII